MSLFNGDVAGKVRNTYLPKTKGMYALFEAIVNSFQSLEDASNTKKPYIHIRIIRDEVFGDDFNPKIKDIEIIDNGEGFTKENFESFKRFDSTHKITKGCKGVGRFVWLKVFETVSIDSVYNGGKNLIRFNFTKSRDDLAEETKSVNLSENKTKIYLRNMLNPYKDAFPQDAEKIASAIIEHCLLFFMEDNCPEVILFDGKSSYNMNEIYKDF